MSSARGVLFFWDRTGKELRTCRGFSLPRESAVRAPCSGEINLLEWIAPDEPVWRIDELRIARTVDVLEMIRHKAAKVYERPPRV